MSNRSALRGGRGFLAGGSAWLAALLPVCVLSAAAEASSAGSSEPGALPLVFREVAAVRVPGAEVVSFDAASGRVWVVGDDGVRCLERDAARGWRVVHGYRPVSASVTHVQVDPAGRGFVVAGVLPNDPREMGRVAVIDADDGSLVAEWPAGHGPDCVVITACGGFVLVANEGEPSRGADGSVFDPPGSITRIDLRGIETLDEVRGLSAERIVTVAPERGWVLEQVRREQRNADGGIRIHPENAATPERDLEPEYIATTGDIAWITLQENNALAMFDIPNARWERLVAIPRMTNTIDASDRDGGINISTVVRCLAMPDQLAILGTPEDPTIFFPGEGDTRSEVGDGLPFADHGRHRALVRAGMAKADPALARLKVCAFTGDTTGDGIIDVPHAFGSRALHRYRPSADEWIDTGSLIERTIAERAPALFNANSTDLNARDGRSDDKGPEPEGLIIVEVDGHSVLIVGLERPGGLIAFDTDLNLLGFDMSAARGHTAPEGMTFIPAQQSPNGIPTLVVGFEGSGSVVFLELEMAGSSE